MLVVLDSSVLVAALRSRRGASFRLLELLRDGQFEIAVSVPLVLEYEAVLVRHAAELNLSREAAVGVVDFLCRVGHRQDIHFLWRPSLPDPQDEFVLELAVAANCEAIVTHNVRDFVGAKKFKPQALTPAAFLAKMWRSL
ncbi:MAG: putative toxin-antitoxin system toxin component, PIN family [Acidobacteria bacterium]|nr:putative toxin-antitoxin system toxin component, PIN family [Acidobacteriota bacterium]